MSRLLALARKLKGWSQRKLEAKCGVDHAVIAQMETGYIKEPSWWNVVRIAWALGLKLDRLANCNSASVANKKGGET